MDLLYDIMVQCWQKDEHTRPPFHVLAQNMQDLHAKLKFYTKSNPVQPKQPVNNGYDRI